jgi:hypothetical protein
MKTVIPIILILIIGGFGFIAVDRATHELFCCKTDPVAMAQQIGHASDSVEACSEVHGTPQYADIDGHHWYIDCLQ